MSGLTTLLKATGTLTATALATYGGIELGDKVGDYLPQAYMLPEMAQGLTAFLTGFTGNHISRRVLGKNMISEKEAYSIAALNAFANVANKARGLSPQESLREISNNLVEVIVEGDKKINRGSGFMITTNGYVITASHVIERMRENDTGAKIMTQNGKSYKVTKENVWRSKGTDIAILKASKISACPHPIKVKVDQDCKLKRGDEVRILGFRDGQKYNTIGMITNPSTTWGQGDGNVVKDLFKTDARGKEGQSGGVVANGNGELIGIVVYSSTKPGEAVGVVGGAKLSNALNYINQIAAEKSAKMFS